MAKAKARSLREGKAATPRVRAGGKVAGSAAQSNAPRVRGGIKSSKPAKPRAAGRTSKSGIPNHIRQLNLVYFLTHHRDGATLEEIAQLRGYSDLGEITERQPVTAAVKRAKTSLRRRWERDREELRTIGIEIDAVPLGNDG
ncbi:MAG: hypothetical protein KDB07_05760, partial [Planctomycetes bacterium]|nr:hypothetical protein [Planctomycetota bacterium]